MTGQITGTHRNWPSWAVSVGLEDEGWEIVSYGLLLWGVVRQYGGRFHWSWVVVQDVCLSVVSEQKFNYRHFRLFSVRCVSAVQFSDDGRTDRIRLFVDRHNFQRNKRKFDVDSPAVELCEWNLDCPSLHHLLPESRNTNVRCHSVTARGWRGFIWEGGTKKHSITAGWVLDFILREGDDGEMDTLRWWVMEIIWTIIPQRLPLLVKWELTRQQDEKNKKTRWSDGSLAVGWIKMTQRDE